MTQQGFHARLQHDQKGLGLGPDLNFDAIGRRSAQYDPARSHDTELGAASCVRHRHCGPLTHAAGGVHEPDKGMEFSERSSKSYDVVQLAQLRAVIRLSALV